MNDDSNSGPGWPLPSPPRVDEPAPPGWTRTPAGYLVPDDLDDDPRLWTGEAVDERCRDCTRGCVGPVCPASAG